VLPADAEDLAMALLRLTDAEVSMEEVMATTTAEMEDVDDQAVLPADSDVDFPATEEDTKATDVDFPATEDTEDTEATASMVRRARRVERSATKLSRKLESTRGRHISTAPQDAVAQVVLMLAAEDIDQSYL
jgi:hypothetical protein